MKIIRLLFSSVIFLSFLLTSPGMTGSGGTHFTTGALAGKYFSFASGNSFKSKFLSYGSAFTSGVFSHLVLDHFYQYEPDFDESSKTQRYFQVEGAVSIILLWKAYKNDPRIFFGSLGGVFPDCEHSLGLGKRYFPTHNGAVPELNFEGLGWGIFQNFTVNFGAIWMIYRGPQSDQPKEKKLIVGCGGKYYPIETEFGNDGLFSPILSMGLWLNDNWQVEHHFSTIIYNRIDAEPKSGYRHARGVITQNAVSLLYFPQIVKCFNYFIKIGGGVTIANDVPMRKNDAIAFGSVEKVWPLVILEIGQQIRLNRHFYLRGFLGTEFSKIWNDLQDVTHRQKYQVSMQANYQF